jgi:transposase-like protein
MPEKLAPGALVSRVAQAHGVNTNHVFFFWRRLHERVLLERKKRHGSTASGRRFRSAGDCEADPSSLLALLECLLR